jgi:hypothetical protein
MSNVFDPPPLANRGLVCAVPGRSGELSSKLGSKVTQTSSRPTVQSDAVRSRLFSVLE